MIFTKFLGGPSKFGSSYEIRVPHDEKHRIQNFSKFVELFEKSNF